MDSLHVPAMDLPFAAQQLLQKCKTEGCPAQAPELEFAAVQSSLECLSKRAAGDEAAKRELHTSAEKLIKWKMLTSEELVTTLEACSGHFS